MSPEFSTRQPVEIALYGDPEWRQEMDDADSELVVDDIAVGDLF